MPLLRSIFCACVHLKWSIRICIKPFEWTHQVQNKRKQKQKPLAHTGNDVCARLKSNAYFFISWKSFSIKLIATSNSIRSFMFLCSTEEEEENWMKWSVSTREWARKIGRKTFSWWLNGCCRTWKLVQNEHRHINTGPIENYFVRDGAPLCVWIR